MKRMKLEDSCFPVSKPTTKLQKSKQVVVAKEYTYTSMQCNRESRNKHLHLWSINF